MAAKLLLFLLLALACACGAVPEAQHTIVLLAPFEGAFRAVGYNAYYAALLALQHADNPRLRLLAVEDGGSAAQTARRARALADDSQVAVVVALGYAATDDTVQRLLGDKPMLMVGQWGQRAVGAGRYVLALSPADWQASIGHTAWQQSGWIAQGPEQLASPLTDVQLAVLPLNYPLLPDLEVISNSATPDADFWQAYAATGLYTPPPNLLATLVYDAVRMAAKAGLSEDPVATLNMISHQGLNGPIQFRDGYWWAAPIYRWRLGADGSLLPLAEDRPVEQR